MQQLFVHGPFTNGMFRKSANQRQCRELQEQLDAGHVVAFDELPILVIGATFKVSFNTHPREKAVQRFFFRDVKLRKVVHFL